MPATFEQLVEFFQSLDSHKSPHSGAVSHLGHSIGVCRELEKWGCDEAVRRAGLFHSVYGTTRAQRIRLPLERRDEVRALIGERAERLAYLNCAIDYETFDETVERAAPPYRMIDRLTGEWVELSEQDFDDLMRVQLADRVEQVPRSRQFDFRRAAFRRMAERLGPRTERRFHETFPPDPVERAEAGLATRIWRVLREQGPATAVKRTVQALIWPMIHELVDRRARELDGHIFEELGGQGRSIAGLAEAVGRLESTSNGLPPAAETAVSLVMPIWNRAHLLRRAVDSVREQTFQAWELLIVDDGSSDKIEAALERYRDDPRIRVFRQERQGAAAARNAALARSRAPLTGYLDSDCVLYPGALEAAWKAFHDAPSADCIYLAQHRFDPATGEGRVCAETFDRRALMGLRCRLDLNAFFHRRAVYERLGGFDEGLTRLQDLDLILRYTEGADPLFVPALVGRYENGHFGISEREAVEPNLSRILAKWRPDGRRPPRVLYVAYSHPQLSESYLRFEIDEMLRRGADVAVWSEDSPMAPYETPEPVFRGALAAAANKFQPDLIHVHWSHYAENKLDTLVEAGVPLTIRGHGFDYAPERIERLLRRPEVKRLYLFPHHAAESPASPRIRATPAALPLDRFRPETKDRKLVLRAGACLPTKDLELFVRAAKRLPEFRFVLCLARVHHPEFTASFVRFVEEQSAPVEFRFDVPHEECFSLFRQAGIFLHTFGPTDPFGMPISIGQALAAECYTLVRDVPGAGAYLADAGALYGDEDHVVELIAATADWTEKQWRESRSRAAARARAFEAIRVLEPMYRDWQAISREQRAAHAAAPS